MGFPVIESRFQAEAHLVLKLAKQPPTSSIVPILIHHPPKDAESATRIFGYLANRVTGKLLTISSWVSLLSPHFDPDFTPSQLAQLRAANIIPIPMQLTSGTDTSTLIKPADCYIGQSSIQFHSALFTFVDFGIHANAFLRACGVKNEPTIQEIAQMLVRDPQEFYRLAGGPEG